MTSFIKSAISDSTHESGPAATVYQSYPFARQDPAEPVRCLHEVRRGLPAGCTIHTDTSWSVYRGR
jgi:hypothetical protein